ncbi:hypothetical protein M422DRAFT_245310 [Sphaerobolus stellatus SS14]|nr:hypothetical protein M422DRAFT_245310 [Sphaerobolus stellatus SS14]
MGAFQNQSTCLSPEDPNSRHTISSTNLKAQSDALNFDPVVHIYPYPYLKTLPVPSHLKTYHVHHAYPRAPPSLMLNFYGDSAVTQDTYSEAAEHGNVILQVIHIVGNGLINFCTEVVFSVEQVYQSLQNSKPKNNFGKHPACLDIHDI